MALFKKLGAAYDIFGGIVGLIVGLVLLIGGDIIWGIILLVLGALLLYRGVKRLKAAKTPKAPEQQ